MGNIVMYDRTEKVFEVDRHSVMAIAGSFGAAWETARTLQHSFQFYRRSQLQEMSLEGKVRALAKLLRDNLGMVLQGVGVVVPLFATFDVASSDPAKVFFYDAMGAHFEATDFAAPDLDAELAARIAEVQGRRAADVGSPTALAAGLHAVIETPLGPVLGDRRLHTIAASRCY